MENGEQAGFCCSVQSRLKDLGQTCFSGALKARRVDILGRIARYLWIESSTVAIGQLLLHSVLQPLQDFKVRLSHEALDLWLHTGRLSRVQLSHDTLDL